MGWVCSYVYIENTQLILRYVYSHFSIAVKSLFQLEKSLTELDPVAKQTVWYKKEEEEEEEKKKVKRLSWKYA